MGTLDFFRNLGKRKPMPVAPTRALLPANGRVNKAAPPPPIALRPSQSRVIAAPTGFRSVADLPKHKSVASLPGGRIALNQAARQHIFVLELDSADDAFCVVATSEHFNSAVFRGVVSQIVDAGGTMKMSGVADAALISRINREQTESQDSNEPDKQIARDIVKLIDEAMDDGVSDVHIEVRSTGACVRFRVNGKLRIHRDSWETEYVNRMARALHTMADDDSKPTSFTTDCQLSVTRTLTNGIRVKLRVQVSPAYPDEGMDIVIRVLRVAAAAKVLSLETLGYARDHIAMLQYMLSSPHGLIMFSGTTGSGKSTTLQTMMQLIRVDGPGKKLISIEDPPEYVLDGVTQIPVARRKGSTENPFAAAMRSTMRMDPDVIMVGEIRDSESAILMTAMVTSGHLALSTIHTESALGIIDRLRSMGAESDVLSGRGFISGLVFQTLVPTVCKHCRIDYASALDDMSDALKDRVHHVTTATDTLFVESKIGCQYCKFTGFSGRTVCAEMVIPDAVIRDCILDGDMRAARTHWQSLHDSNDPDSMMGTTALEHAILKMRRGDVSPQAVEGELGLLHDFNRQVGPAEPSIDLGEIAELAAV